MIMTDTKQDRITIALKKHGGFFAFSNEQFDEQKKEGVKYSSLGSGLIVPKVNADELIKDINTATDLNIEDDLTRNTKTEIILRELANHEAQITGSITDTVEALKGYDITREEVQAEFRGYLDNCIEHNVF